MGKKKTDFCAYCGNWEQVTVDHVIPQCLYGNKKPQKVQMITVKACHHCNNGRAADERELRNAFSVEVQNYDHELKPYLTSRLIASIQENKTKVGKALTHAELLIPVYTPKGVEYYYPIRVDSAPLNRALKKIIRGLQFYYWNERILSDQQISLGKFPPNEQFSQTVDALISMPGNIVKVLSDDDQDEVFGFASLKDPVRTSKTYWALCFYRRICYFAAVNAPDFKENNN